MSTKNYESWLAVDKVIAIIKQLTFEPPCVFDKQRIFVCFRQKIFLLRPAICGSWLAILLYNFYAASSLGQV